MAENNTKYDAFISYRHAELDKYVAVTLHKKLEAFKLPAGVVSPTGKKKIERVFRDQDELPLSSNLSDPINEALEASDFLIVICTPRLPESEWCNREIETFIKLHGREHILAVLAEGEPDESFPEGLTKEEYEVKKPDGTVEKKVRYFEPLAADVRGKNKKQINKAMNDAVLRIGASLFSLNYDALKQRHKERAMKRTLSVVSGIAAALLLFSAVCIGLLFKIINQSEMILDQNNEIMTQNNEIKNQAAEIQKQNEQIQEQYTQAQINLAVATSQTADSLLRSGRKLDAVYALRNVMPESLDDTSYPYTPEAEYALADTLEVYNDNSLLSAGRTFESESVIKTMKVSPDYTKLMTFDDAGYLHVWDLLTGEELFGSALKQSYKNFSNADFIDSDSIFLEDDGKLYKYDLSSKEKNEIPFVMDGGFNRAKIFCTPLHQKMVIFYNPSVFAELYMTIYDFEKEDYVLNIPVSDIKLDIGTSGDVYHLDFSPDGRYIAFSLASAFSNGLNIVVIDTETYDFSLYPISSYDSTNTLTFDGDNIFVSGISYFAEIGSGSNFITNINYISKNEVWTIPTPKNASILRTNPDCSILYVGAYDFVYLIDKESGKMLREQSVGENIVNLTTPDEDTVNILTSDCLVYQYIPSTNFLQLFDLLYHSILPNIGADYVISGENRVLVHFEAATYVSLYCNYESPEPLMDFPYATFNDMNDSSNLLLRKLYNDIQLVNLETFEEPRHFETEDSSAYCTFVGDGSKYFSVYGSSLKTYNISDGSLYRELSDDISFSSNGLNGISYDRKYVLSKMYQGTLYVYSLETCEKVNEFHPNLQSTEGLILVLLDKDTYAIIRDSGIIDVYQGDNPDPVFTSSRPIRNADRFNVCKNQKIFIISYYDGTAEIYDFSDSLKLVDSIMLNHFILGAIKGLSYYPDQHMYVFSCTSGSYLLNDDFESLAFIANYNVMYQPSKDRFLYCHNDMLYSFPHYSYDDLIEESKKFLKDYEPSEYTINKYNIPVK